eukprot:IDg11950t1
MEEEIECAPHIERCPTAAAYRCIAHRAAAVACCLALLRMLSGAVAPVVCRPSHGHQHVCHVAHARPTRYDTRGMICTPVAPITRRSRRHAAQRDRARTTDGSRSASTAVRTSQPRHAAHNAPHISRTGCTRPMAKRRAQFRYALRPISASANSAAARTAYAPCTRITRRDAAHPRPPFSSTSRIYRDIAARTHRAERRLIPPSLDRATPCRTHRRAVLYARSK